MSQSYHANGIRARDSGFIGTPFKLAESSRSGRRRPLWVAKPRHYQRRLAPVGVIPPGTIQPILIQAVVLNLQCLLDLRGAYLGFIVALNWARVLQAVLLVMVSGAAAAAGAPSDFLTLTAIGAVLAYQWVVTRTALATTGPIAAALVIIDTLLESLIVATAMAIA